MKVTSLLAVGVFLLTALAGPGVAQTVASQEPAQWVAARRQVLAVTYNENKQTTVTMAGTGLVPNLRGKADVEFKRGRTNVRLEMESFPNPQSLGGLYTSYVLWAVAPEGQTQNLMELPINKNFKIESTTNYQTFGLMITAEPHSRVELPSSMIVAQNVLNESTRGRLTTSTIEYSGDPGVYFALFSPATSPAMTDYNTPLMILGARHSVGIAQMAGARTRAATELRDAEVKLAQLEQSWPRSRKESDLRRNAQQNSGLAHEVMRLGENARNLSVTRRAQARLDEERAQAGTNLARANSEAERSRLDVERANVNADASRADAQNARRSELETAERSANETEAAKARTAQAKSETGEARAREASARAEADTANQHAAQARGERDAARQNLYTSLSAILETRQEARGLIVNLSDFLFDTGKTGLRSGAREKLSRLSGVMVAYSGPYRMEIEGHTDSIGSESSNLVLSQGRADSVREYLRQNGVKSEFMNAAQGFGESKPVATNDTAAGRQVNRHVEIIISDQPMRQPKVSIQ